MLRVVFASDDNYAGLLFTSLISLIENNNKNFKKIYIYILDDGISEKNKEKLNRITKKYSCEISFIESKKLEKMNINLFGEYGGDFVGKSLTFYARLFIPELIPQDVDKVLYLDCDSLTVGSLKDVWKLNIENFSCAGVLDLLNGEILEYFGFEKDDSYINTGFLLINLKKWREDNLEQKFIQYLQETDGTFTLYDQGIINEICKNNIKILEPKYNLQTYYQTFSYEVANVFKGFENGYYTKEIVEDSKKNPVFLHFAGAAIDRPWHNKDHIYAKEFEKYAKMAECDYVIDYVKAPNMIIKFIYKFADNRLFNSLMKIAPKKFISARITKNMIDSLNETNRKSKEYVKNNRKTI